MSNGTRRNVFVVGLDDFNLQRLRNIHGADRLRFHGLIDPERVTNPVSYDVSAIVADAKRELDSFDGSIDGIIGHWDFPTSTMLPILHRHCGLRGPSLESVLRCEHKYWSRALQQRVVPEHTPHYNRVNPFAERPLAQVHLPYPFWLKPVKAHSGHLGFHIDGPDTFHEAIKVMRERIGRIAEPFNWFLKQSDIEAEAREVDGFHCVAEELVHGNLCTLEGFVFEGKPEVYAIIDTRKARNRFSLWRYAYPSELPKRVQGKMTAIADRVMRYLEFDNGPFNIEMFYDPESEDIKILEINPRISRSHSPLFELAEGASHHEVAVAIQLGQRPDFPAGRGQFACASKFMARVYRDKIVRRVPTQEEIDAVQAKIPGLHVGFEVSTGTQLSRLQNQDSYSYEYAMVYAGGDTPSDALDKYHQAMNELPIELEDV
jgi:biotin carboxylase